MQRVQIIVRGAILLLLVLLAFLGYYYWKLITPPTQVGQDQGAGIGHIVSMYGYGSSKDEQLEGPDGVAVDDENGDIYVSDSGHSRIMVFNSNGKYLRKFGKKGTNKNELLFPLGIEVHKGRVYVASMISSKLLIYTTQGKLVKEVLMDRPIRVKENKGKLWLSTPGQIWTTDLNGNVLRRYFRKGQALGQLNYPNGLGFDSSDNVFISDTMNNRLQIMDKSGNLVGIKGVPTSEMNQQKRMFGLGMGLTIDDSDRIYVADAFHSSIQVFDHDGELLAEMGVEGTNDGQLDHPSEIVWAGGNRFVVADKNNDRVQVLSVSAPAKAGDPIPTPTSPLVYVLGFLALVIVAWIISRILKSRRSIQEESSF